MVVGELAAESVNESINLFGEITSVPTALFNPLISNLNQLMQAVQYFGTALIVLYVLFIALRYLEFRRVRHSLTSLEKEIGHLKRELRHVRRLHFPQKGFSLLARKRK